MTRCVKRTREGAPADAGRAGAEGNGAAAAAPPPPAGQTADQRDPTGMRGDDNGSSAGDGSTERPTPATLVCGQGGTSAPATTGIEVTAAGPDRTMEREQILNSRLTDNSPAAAPSGLSRARPGTRQYIRVNRGVIHLRADIAAAARSFLPSERLHAHARLDP